MSKNSVISLPDSLHKLSSLNNFKKHFKYPLFIISLLAEHDNGDVKHSRQHVLLTALHNLSILLIY